MSKRVFLFLVVVLFAGVEVRAQTATLRGFVTDASDGGALQGANVVLEDTAGQLYGAASGTDGFYTVVRVPAGRYTVRVSYLGYRPHTDTLALGADERLLYNVRLVPAPPDELGEVVVERTRGTGGAGLTAGAQTIEPADIDLVPSPDIAGDLALYLSTLPGVVSPGDQGGQFFIRGGEPSHNLILLDGMIVYQPFHVLSFFSAFSTEVLSHVDLYAGGYGARYGGRLSSVIDVHARTGNKERTEASASASPFLVSGHVEGPLRFGYSYLLAARQSVVEEAAARLVAAPVPFLFNDVFVKIHGPVRRSSKLSLTALRTFDRGTIGEEVGGKPPEAVRWRNEAVGARYLFLPGALPVLATFTFNLSRLHSEFEETPERFQERFSRTTRYNMAADMLHFGGWADTRWGLFARTLETFSELGGLYQNVRIDREFLTEAGIYLEPELRPREDLRITTGLRVHAFPSKNKTFLEPRLRAIWDRGQHRFSAAAGIYHQEIIGLNDRRDARSVFTAWTAAPNRRVPRAIHAILGYQTGFGNGIQVVAEGYYKHLANLSIAEWTAFPRLTTRLQPADGRVIGLDLRVEVQKRHFYALLAYGLSSVEYEAQQVSLPVWFGTDRLRFRPAHDRRHQLNLLLGTTFAGFKLGARWHFGSGLPFNRARGFDGFVLMNRGVDVFATEGSQRVIYERPFDGILPTYHRLDLSAERKIRIGNTRLEVQASVLNVYDRANIFYLDVFTLRRVDQLPIIPSFGIKMEWPQ